MSGQLVTIVVPDISSLVKACGQDIMWVKINAAAAAAAAAKPLQSCLTLCDPIDCSPSGSPVAGIIQARTTEWVAISFSNA